MYDVAIVGGGVSGCSLLYQLSRFRLSVALFEKENDVALGSTKANSGIIHAGYDPEPGTLMAEVNVPGNAMIRQLCADLDILFRQTGSLVVAFAGERERVEQLLARGRQNGVPDLRILKRDELLAREPALNPEVVCGLYAPTAGVVNSWELALAQVEVAIENGANIHRMAEVYSMQRERNGFLLRTRAGDFHARFVVNAGGVLADHITAMVGPPGYAIHPTRGQYYLLDKTQGWMVRHVIFQCPTDKGKGVLVAPTSHGNLIVGPDSDPGDAHDPSTTAAGLQYVRRLALRSVPGLRFEASIRNFAGLRARPGSGDFVVGPSENASGFFEMSGIQSPGLSSAPAIAKKLVKMLEKSGLKLEEKSDFNARRQILRFRHLSESERAEAIRQNPLYGQIVCRCETVTEGEIVDAFRRPLPPLSLDGVKRRCMPGMGRCQGGFCGPRVQAIIARELGIPQAKVPLDREGMDIILGRTKDAAFRREGRA